MKSYSTRDVARLIGLSEGQVRAHARLGYLAPDRGPRNAYRFSFQDLILLRTAKALTDARVPPRRIRRALRALARELPEGRALSGVRISSEGEQIVVRDGHERWYPESGQLLLDFDVGELATRIAPVARRIAKQARRSDDARTAEEWYHLGTDLEAAAPNDAADAYERALALDPTYVPARVNLGRLLQEAGQLSAAVEHYEIALAIRSDHSIAAFNLGTAFEELGRHDDAADAYERALAADAELADAHFNLARVAERMGRRTTAIRHFHAYRRLSGR